MDIRVRQKAFCLLAKGALLTGSPLLVNDPSYAAVIKKKPLL